MSTVAFLREFGMMSEMVFRQFVVGICVNNVAVILANNVVGNLNHQFVLFLCFASFLTVSANVVPSSQSNNKIFVIYRYSALDIQLLDFDRATFFARHIREETQKAAFWAVTLFNSSRFYLRFLMEIPRK